MKYPFLALVLLASACSGGGNATPPAPLPVAPQAVATPQPTLVALGDSITLGAGTSEFTGTSAGPPSPNAYPFLVGTSLGASVTDLAIGGTTSAMISAQEVPLMAPGATYVIIAAGANDVVHFSAPGYPVETLAQHEADHLTLCQAVRAKEPKAKIVVLTVADYEPQPYPGFTAAFDAAIRANAAAIGASVADIETDPILNNPADYADANHPSDPGNSEIARVVLAAL
jgi:lysophospholipase L1-like esterase